MSIASTKKAYDEHRPTVTSEEATYRDPMHSYLQSMRGVVETQRFVKKYRDDAVLNKFSNPSSRQRSP